MKKLRDMLVCRICPGFLEMFGSVGHASIVQEETSHGAHSTRWPSMHICGVLFCCTPAACLVWSEEDPLSNHIDVFLPILRLHLDVMKQQGNTWYLQRVKARFLMSCPFCLKCFHCFEFWPLPLFTFTCLLVGRDVESVGWPLVSPLVTSSCTHSRYLGQL